MTKEIETKPFGKMQIDERQILNFPEGILGFEKYNEFALIEENQESPFKWLQSLNEIDLAFIVIQPDLFAPDYKPALAK
jgi:flagellar assembly factor FliW